MGFWVSGFRFRGLGVWRARRAGGGGGGGGHGGFLVHVLVHVLIPNILQPDPDLKQSLLNHIITSSALEDTLSAVVREGRVLELQAILCGVTSTGLLVGLLAEHPKEACRLVHKHLPYIKEVNPKP